VSADALHLFINFICLRIQTLRTPLGDVDPNSRRRLQSGSTTTKAALVRAVKRPRGRLVLSVPIEAIPKASRPQGRPQTLTNSSVRTLRLQGRPLILPTLNEQSVEVPRPRGRPTTLAIYEDLVLDCETLS
jgi:hypothetical protein